MSNTQIQISLSDIIGVVSIIDIVSARGAFKGQELSSVGNLRDKLSLFVEQNTPKEEKPDTVETLNE